MMMTMMGSNLDLEVYEKCECNISSLLRKKMGEDSFSARQELFIVCNQNMKV